MDIQDFDASSQVKKRLPQEVKQKLAKVARLAVKFEIFCIQLPNGVPI